MTSEKDWWEWEHMILCTLGQDDDDDDDPADTCPQERKTDFCKNVFTSSHLCTSAPSGIPEMKNFSVRTQIKKTDLGNTFFLYIVSLLQFSRVHLSGSGNTQLDYALL